jgi:hypothetical protein
MLTTQTIDQMLEQTNQDLMKFQSLFLRDEFEPEKYRMYLLAEQTLKTKIKKTTSHYFNFLQYIKLIDNWQLHFHLERIDKIHSSFHKLFVILEKALKRKSSIVGKGTNRNGGKFKTFA